MSRFYVGQRVRVVRVERPELNSHIVGMEAVVVGVLYKGRLVIDLIKRKDVYGEWIRSDYVVPVIPPHEAADMRVLSRLLPNVFGEVRA